MNKKLFTSGASVLQFHGKTSDVLRLAADYIDNELSGDDDRISIINVRWLGEGETVVYLVSDMIPLPEPDTIEFPDAPDLSEYRDEKTDVVYLKLNGKWIAEKNLTDPVHKEYVRRTREFGMI